MKNPAVSCELVNKVEMGGPPTHWLPPGKATHRDAGGRLLNEHPRGSPERTGWLGPGAECRQVRELWSCCCGTSLIRKENKETDPENHTALLFNGTSPFNAVLNHTPKKKSPEKFLQINQ